MLLVDYGCYSNEKIMIFMFIEFLFRCLQIFKIHSYVHDLILIKFQLGVQDSQRPLFLSATAIRLNIG